MPQLGYNNKFLLRRGNKTFYHSISLQCVIGMYGFPHVLVCLGDTAQQPYCRRLCRRLSFRLRRREIAWNIASAALRARSLTATIYIITRMWVNRSARPDLPRFCAGGKRRNFAWPCKNTRPSASRQAYKYMKTGGK